MVLCHTSEFEIHKNIVNVFVLKNIYVKSTPPDSNFDYSVKFLRNVRNIVTPIRQSLADVNLKFDKKFAQTNFIPPALISLIGLLIENNSSSATPSQSTMTIARMIVYNFKKNTRKNEIAVKNPAMGHRIKRETPIVSYVSLRLYCSIRSKNLLQRLVRPIIVSLTYFQGGQALLCKPTETITR